MSDLAEFLAVRAHALVHRFASWVTSIPVGLVLASRVICSPQSASFPFVLLPLRFRLTPYIIQRVPILFQQKCAHCQHLFKYLSSSMSVFHYFLYLTNTLFFVFHT